MTTILPSARSPMDAILDQVGHGLSQTLPQAALQRSNREALLSSLGNIKNVANNPNASNLDVILSTLQAGAGIPGSERYIGQVLPEMLRQVEANRAQNRPLPGEVSQDQIPPVQARNREAIEPMAQRKELPSRTFGENRFFPTNLGPAGGPGHIPQEATSGQKIPLLAPNELPAAYKAHQARSTAAGIPMTLSEAKAEVDAHQGTIKDHNKAVDEELKQQVLAQKNYGQKAVDELKKVYPQATPELETVFQKFGEEEAQKGKSEAEINRSLATKAKDFSNQIASIKKDASAPRLFNSIGSAFNGTYKNAEKSIQDLRVKIKPLLDQGLYETARNLVSELGYYPEEVDMTVNPLGEREKVVFNKVPGRKWGSIEKPELPVNAQSIKQGLRDLKEANPNFSLVLARKMFEDKRYDWRQFKDALNDLMENEGYELTTDQRNQLLNLDSPPLSGLQKVLHGINLIGR